MVERCPALFALNLRPHGDFSGGMLSAQDSCPSSRLALLTLATHALPSPRLVGGQVATGAAPQSAMFPCVGPPSPWSPRHSGPERFV